MGIAAHANESSKYTFVLTADTYDEYNKLKEIYSLVPFCENYAGLSFLYNKYDFPFIVSELDKIGLKNRRIDKKLYESIKSLHNITPLKIHPDLQARIKREVKPFQVEAIERMSGSPFYLLGDLMGLGKTSSALLTVMNLLAYGKASSAVIVATASSLGKWSDECSKIFGKKHGIDIVVADGGKEQRAQIFRDEHQITVINLESLARDYKQLMKYNKFKRFISNSIIVVDEAHRIKNYDTLNHKSVYALGNMALRKYALTGTPMDGKLTSIYGIFRFLHQPLFGKFSSFDKFHIKRDFFGGIDSFKNVDIVEKKAKPFILRRRKEEVLGSFPSIVEKDYIIPMTAAEQKIYKKLEKSEIQELYDSKLISEDARIDPDMEISIFSACCQWCDCPGLVDPQWKQVGSKMKALDEILEQVIEGGNKVVVFTKFKMMLDILSKYLKYDMCLLYGSMSSKERKESMDEFLANPDKKVFLMTTAGKESIDLHGTEIDGKWVDGANYLIMYDSMMNPAVNEQITGRIDRIGQQKSMTVIRLFSKGTIEETDVRDTILKRMKINKAVLEGAGL